MNVFAILGHEENPELAAAIQAHYPGNFLKVGPGQWFVAGKETTVDVSNALGISDGLNGLAVVVSISSYYGRASTNIWEWLKVKMSTP